jgi:hypothetical protein
MYYRCKCSLSNQILSDQGEEQCIKTFMITSSSSRSGIQRPALCALTAESSTLADRKAKMRLLPNVTARGGEIRTFRGGGNPGVTVEWD